MNSTPEGSRHPPEVQRQVVRVTPELIKAARYLLYVAEEFEGQDNITVHADKFTVAITSHRTATEIGPEDLAQEEDLNDDEWHDNFPVD